MKLRSNKVVDVVQYIIDQLKSNYDVNEARSFVEMIFQSVFGYSKVDIVLKYDKTVSESDLLKINNIIKRLKKQEPIQYILGEADFYGMKYFVNPSVLIPRPETEELVQWIIRDLKIKNKESLNVIDIGAGSGCIAISLKKSFEKAKLHAMDISKESLSVLKQNAEKYRVAIEIFCDDILKPKDEQYPKFDVIVSNPPYVRESEKELMKPNVLQFEPQQALFISDEDPLVFYKAIGLFGIKHLNDEGALYFEINENLSSQTTTLLERMGYHEIAVKQDIHGKDRMVRCTRRK